MGCAASYESVAQSMRSSPSSLDVQLACLENLESTIGNWDDKGPGANSDSIRLVVAALQNFSGDKRLVLQVLTVLNKFLRGCTNPVDVFAKQV